MRTMEEIVEQVKETLGLVSMQHYFWLAHDGRPCWRETTQWMQGYRGSESSNLIHGALGYRERLFYCVLASLWVCCKALLFVVS